MSPDPGSYYSHYVGRNRNGLGVRVKQRIARQIVSLAQLPARANVLEIGPGDGDIAELLRTHDYCAVEPSPAIAANLRDRGFRVIEGFAPPLPDTGPLDAVFALHVIEHMLHIAAVGEFLSEARERLTPTGRIILATPDYARWGAHFFDSDYTHCLPFTARRLKQTIESAGLKVVYDGLQTGPFFHRAAAPLAAVAKWLWAPSLQDLARLRLPRDIAARAFLTVLPNLVMVGGLR